MLLKSKDLANNIYVSRIGAILAFE